MSELDRDYVRRLIRDRAAIVLDEGKDYLIDSRLLPLCRSRALPDLAALVARLRTDRSGLLAQEVVEALTTNETSFFRDVHYYEALREHVIPALIEARARERALRVWCAASSTGQEPYSVAMVLAEMRELEGWKLEIVATDIDRQVLKRAREGLYSQREVNRGLPARKLVRHFSRVGLQWQVRDSIRRMVTCQSLHLERPWPVMPAMDVILMRNVLIYFDAPTKRNVLSQVNRVLRSDGHLLLGSTESMIDLSEDFRAVRVGRAVVYRPFDRRAGARAVATGPY